MNSEGRIGSFSTSRERLRDAAKHLIAQKGFEATTTAEIARLAGTSESQLIKHFGDKQGILRALLEYAWEQINPAVRLSTAKIDSPAEKLLTMLNIVLSFLEGDDALQTIILLEGRRARAEGHEVMVAEGFLEFLGMLDGALQELAESNQLAPGIHPQALRSALIGSMEGMLRDHLLRHTIPASFSEADARKVFQLFLSACQNK